MKTVTLSLSSEIYEKIEKALEAKGLPPSDENVHSFILELVTERLGKTGK